MATLLPSASCEILSVTDGKGSIGTRSSIGRITHPLRIGILKGLFETRRIDPASEDSWTKRLCEAGLPVFERLLVVKRCKNIEEYNSELQSMISGLPPGLSCILVHPARDSEELRRIATDWRYRVIEYQALLQKRLWAYAADAGVEIINYERLARDVAVQHAAVSGSQ